MKILLATTNPGKLVEFKTALGHLPIEIISQASLHIPEAVEDGKTFLDNALIKARHAARYTQLPILADDSGIEVDALDGAPGIYSARYAGPHANANTNNEKLLMSLRDVPNSMRTARFRCALVFLPNQDDLAPIVAEGVWEGFILSDAQGEQGFGYDPVFFDPKQQCSAAAIPAALKNKISHRGQALQKLLTQLEKYLLKTI